ncbi:MAG: FG-GAP repeat domain-containing protein [Phycisphaerales bacterium]
MVRSVLTASATLAAALVRLVSPVVAQDAELADYFGFDPMEILVIDDSFGPVTIADLNDDGRNDLVVVNNRKSRLELYYQRAERPDESASDLKVNELEPLWRFRREIVTVSHRVDAVVAHDFDDDGRMDLIYGGSPSEIIMLGQTRPGVFSVVGRRRVRDLSANRDGMRIVDFGRPGGPELAALVGDEIHLFPIESDALGQPRILTVGARVSAFYANDYTGDGRADLLAVAPDERTPARLWVTGAAESTSGAASAQYRFEMPALRELEPLPFAEGRAGFATIERASKRWTLYFVEDESADDADRAPMIVYAFPKTSGPQRDVAVVDVDGDGRLDVLATDSGANALLLYRQRPGRGLGAVERHPSLAEPTVLATGQIDDDPAAEAFVLSVEESVAGRSDFADDAFTFPAPLPTKGELVTLELANLGGPTVAIVSKDRRDYTLRLIPLEGEPVDIELEGMTKSPESIVTWDADQDGRNDLLLLTPGSPMTMLRATGDGSLDFELLESDDMGQYGLVQAASAANSAFFDVDGDGAAELLVADRNFVRALRYEPEAPEEGGSAGWQVVEQFNVDDPRSELTAIAIADRRAFVMDNANRRLILLERDAEGDDGGWRETDDLDVSGFDLKSVHAADFTGDGAVDALGVGADGFAVIQLTGGGLTLREFASWRSDEEDRLEHELTAGDLNGDGFLDLVALDAGEQMLEIATISRAGRLLPVTEFEIYQSQLFEGGDSREFEPRNALIADVTGDGANDLLLIVHDRILIYPQSTTPNVGR